MKQENKNIAQNTSSGAEKVETIERKTASAPKKTSAKTTVKKSITSAQGEAALGSAPKKVNAKKINAQSAGSKAEKESEAAKARVEKALRKKEAKEKRKAARLEKQKKKKELRAKKAAEKKALIAKRAAEKKARAEKHAAERKALAEKRKAEKEAKIRERARGKANRNNANARKQSAKAKNREERRRARREKRENRRQNRERGYGGWIAAVVSLGVVTLALATTVTVGAVEMKRGNDAMMNAYRGTMYELTGTMEHVDNDLDRLRVSATPAQQSRLLTDILVQTRIAEVDLEKLPISAEEERNVTIFVNRTAMECERMLSKIRNGEALNGEDMAEIERLYKTTHTIRAELDKLVNTMSDKDMSSFMKKGEGMISDTLKNLEKTTLEENRAAFHRHLPPCREACADKGSKIDPAHAEEFCKKYFSSYKVADFQCVGETVTAEYAAYNVQGYDENGTMLFAEVRQQDGVLIGFDYYEDCSAENMDVRSAELVAEEFLDKLGYDDMEVVRLRENGTTVDFTFVYEDDGVLYYPDTVQVKVCRTRGTVAGLDAHKYLRNHKDREEPEIQLTLAQAKDKLNEKLNVESARVAVVKTMRGERAAYEFFCSYGKEQYFVYLDAENGNEISIVNAKTVW